MNSNLSIKRFEYSKDGVSEMLTFPQGKNWPHVYLIHDDKSLYIGETQNISQRTKEHLTSNDVKVKKNSSVIDTIYDDSFNKSAILDIEQQLIRFFSADGYFNLLNTQKGQSYLHNYYQKEYYHNELIRKIWDQLVQNKVAKKPLILLENLDIFKYSPYVSLTEEQLDICEEVLIDMVNTIPNHTGTFVINGSAGTGKTVLAIYLLNVLKEIIVSDNDNSNSEEYDEMMSSFSVVKSLLKNILKEKGIKKIGFVVPMESLRKTLSEIFNSLKLSKVVKVVGPYDVVNENFDIIFVDESHRLSSRKNIFTFLQNNFDDKCKQLELDPATSNQLQWIMLKSKYTVLFYDEAQSIKRADVTKEDFNNALSMHDSVKTATLKSQLRCKGGADYIQYVDDILRCASNIKKETFLPDYEVLLFEHINDLRDILKEKEIDYGLCRLVAGYAWEWKTKKTKKYEDIVASGGYDIEIEGVHLIWNTEATKWINSKHAVDEVGCIHTTQGYDLNYAGIIFGPEIDYDPVKKEIIINKSNFHDRNVKAGTTPEELKQFIINTYGVIMKRGIKGTYLYVVNDNLRDYFKQFFDVYKPGSDN